MQHLTVIFYNTDFRILEKIIMAILNILQKQGITLQLKTYK